MSNDNDNNKLIIAKAQALLKEYGHEVKTGHLYEVFSKLSNENNWNIAKAKNTSFFEKFIGSFRSQEKLSISEKAKIVRDKYLDLITTKGNKFDLGLLVDSNKIITKDFYKEPNAIFVGSMGSGKSVSMSGTIFNWVVKNKQNALVFIIDTLKGANDYKALFELENVYPILNSEKGFFYTIEMMYDEIMSRRDALNSVNAESLIDYEKKTGIKLNECLIVLEEFHHACYLMDFERNKGNKESVAFKLHTIMKIGQSFGVWILAATQKATKSDVPPELLSNFVNKFVFRTSKPESAYLIGTTEPADLIATDKGVCFSEYGKVQFPFFTEEEQSMVLSKNKDQFKLKCSLLDDKVIDMYLSGQFRAAQIEKRSITDLVNNIEMFPHELVLEKLHKLMGQKVEVLNSKTERNGLSLIIEWEKNLKVAAMYRGENQKITSKHIINMAKGMENYSAKRGIIYTSSQEVPVAIYRLAVEHNIEIVDNEDLLRLASQIEDKNK